MQAQLSPATCVLEKLESDVCGDVFWNEGIVSDVTANVTLQLLPRSFVKNPQQWSPFSRMQLFCMWAVSKRGSLAKLWLSAIAVDLGIWLWSLVVQNEGWRKLCVTTVWHGEGLRLDSSWNIMSKNNRTIS